MRELHTDDASADNGIITQEHAQTDLGTVENGPELATGGNEDSDTINQDSEQDGVNKAINKAHHLKHKAERATAAETKRANELQARLDAIDANKPAPTISALPDPYDVSDDEYKAAIARRDDQVGAAAVHSNAEAARQDAATQKDNDAAAERNRRIVESGDNYRNRAKELNVTADQLNTAANIIVDYGISADVGTFIMNDPNGPLITQYLSKNLSELTELTRMSPMEAAVMISQKISPKLSSVKPVNSNAPAPLNAVKGSGAAPKKRGASGTTFE